MKRIPELLHSPDVELRIAAGETLAVIHEMARGHVEVIGLIHFGEFCLRLMKPVLR